jgi:lysophospholipase L1-like esterase
MRTLVARQLTQPSPQSVPLRVVALGDSLIYGYGDPEGGGWVERSRRQCLNPDSPGHVIYNLGIRGNCVSQVSRRLEQEFRLRGELRNNHPDLIILSVGVNDSAHLGKPEGRLYTPIDSFEEEMQQLLRQAQQLCPVLFVGMIPVNEAKMPFLDCFYYRRTTQHRYKEITRLACQTHNIPYLDLFDLWMQRGNDWILRNLCKDGLHPNVTGYEALFYEITRWQPFEQYLGKLNPELK